MHLFSLECYTGNVERTLSSTLRLNEDQKFDFFLVNFELLRQGSTLFLPSNHVRWFIESSMVSSISVNFPFNKRIYHISKCNDMLMKVFSSLWSFSINIAAFLKLKLLFHYIVK